MRLTKKIKKDYYMTCEIDVLDGMPNLKEHAKKLGKLEDVEENLGISFDTLLDMQLNGNFYIKTEKGKVEKARKYKNCSLYFETPQFGLMYKYKSYRFFYYYHYFRKFYFKDYGKTWALTKEELE